MSYTALYRKFRPDEFEDVKRTGCDRPDIEEPDQCRSYRTCIFVLRDQRNRKDNRCEDICESSQLRTSGRWKPVRGVRNVPVDRSWYIDECDRD